MLLFRKNIILVPSDYDGISLQKGLLTMDCFENNCEAILKLYNMDFEDELLLGINISNKLFKYNINTKTQNNFEINLPAKIRQTDDISCVLLQLKNNNYHIVLWGSTQINSAWKSTLEMMLEDEIKSVNINSNIEENIENYQKNSENLQKNSKNNEFFVKNNSFYENQVTKQYSFENKKNDDLDFENDENQKSQKNQQTSFIDKDQQQFKLDDDVEKFIDKVIKLTDESKIYLKNEDYKNSSFEQGNNTNFDNEGKTKIDLDEKNDDTFYKKIEPQIDKLLNNNQVEPVLIELIPNSKFVRIEFDDKTGYYIFGVIYENNFPKYICYGMPARKDEKPPVEFSEIYQWFPVDINDMSGDGFYVTFQDAKTGKTIEVEIN